ncbi:MAG TPA: DUF4245 family protein [Mycobacteriales bacterium]|nr:DUF4245 family protein [Mycobacteriales bacterium]
MSTGTSTTAPPARRRSPGRSLPGLLWSLLPLLAIVLLVALWQQGRPQTVATVDTAGDIAYARRISSIALPAPAGLPGGWRATSSRVDAPLGETAPGPVTLDIGYLTLAGRFARVVVSTEPVEVVLMEQVQSASRDGSAAVGRATWDRYRTQRGEEALVSRVSRATVVVTGDASAADLTLLAAAVGPAG